MVASMLAGEVPAAPARVCIPGEQAAPDVTIEAAGRSVPDPGGAGQGLVTSTLTGNVAIASAAVRESSEEGTKPCRCTIGRTNEDGTASTCSG